MQNIDKGNSKVDRKIFPSSARGVEEDQRQPGQFPGRLEVGEAVRAQLPMAQPGTCQPWAKQQENPGMSQVIWD